MSEHAKVEHIVTYTMDGVGYGRTVSGKDEKEVKALFLEDMKAQHPASCESIVIVSVETAKEAKAEAKAEAKEAAKHKTEDEK